MTAINIEILSNPSTSKGWARYSAPGAAVRSNTGNQWVSADHSGEVAEGAEFVLTTQVCLITGKAKRKEITTEEVRLVAREGASCVVSNIPGSQGLRLAISGAVVA